ncbi:hypothetical protein AWR38_12490 [Idiomarina sp. WRN-38]|uniref:DUF2909 domain-containing protein n=1 Tax=Idiomarina piscisalsi TaxID=1096243 RepID=A0A432YSJ8_9GAMM|nr:MULTISPECIES: DUF2909 domain-containing protein [Idiomarina]KTG28919.1 hypothetical protein AUR68_12475 [Idiomarina sp. H105]MBF38937.1 DUF2909 domain-containing protein [Idiomarinaceae bacterium]OAF09684.1 hypothetical protein AWR38_12490 [Idiomarina sp. WRN-38]MCH2454091.1 DUF2909 domain-containing protein [Idiomarina sp.]MCJ8317425.1 DUF2909 domain-containing protein [Idiomarina sp.]
MLVVFKVIIVLLLVYMVVNLFRALFSMLRNDPNKPPMSHYLGKRVGIAAIILIALIAATYGGFLPLNPRPY